MAEGSLFGPDERKAFFDPFNSDNPVTIQVLGICSALAVTSQLKPSLVMGAAVMVVLTGANVTVSLIRKQIPQKVRIIVEMVVVASLVILVDQFLKAYMFDVSKQLSVFVGLIITNCIVLGRLEAFAMGNKPWVSLLDGIGNGFGYAIVLAIIGLVRELMGSGMVLGMRVIPDSIYFDPATNEGWYVNNGMLVLPPAAFLILGFICWAQQTYNLRRAEK